MKSLTAFGFRSDRNVGFLSLIGTDPVSRRICGFSEAVLSFFTIKGIVGAVVDASLELFKYLFAGVKRCFFRLLEPWLKAPIGDREALRYCSDFQ